VTPATSAVTLPVRRVVLYKNGVGYFEHLGRVRGNESINVDFTSAQLDDVINSLTVLDLGDGRVNGISYNSEAPVGERLGSLRLAVGDRATLPQLLDALRGARLEVRTGGRVVSGRLLGVERHVRGTGPTAVSRDELTIVSDTGEIRTVELTSAASVRLVERDAANQVGSYLGVLASTRAPDRRRMTISTTGSGVRDLLVSYISEAPVWKTTYRIVLTPEDPPLLQGWAVVDNTTGEDWTNVELSLVAGAPQSFVQRISQPQYLRRPVVATSQGMQLTPQTHAATLSGSVGAVQGRVTDASGGALAGVRVQLLNAQGRASQQATTGNDGRYSFSGVAGGTYAVVFTLAGFATAKRDGVALDSGYEVTVNAELRPGSLEETVTVTGETPRTVIVTKNVGIEGSGIVSGVSGGIGGGMGGGIYSPAQAAAQPAPVAESGSLGELFEYRITSPMSIPRNNSALVPIIRSAVSMERVSLWNGRGGTRPLRALWVTNTSGLTLDAGAFTIVENGSFAGEGLVDQLKPDEKRLLSYAVDLGVQVQSTQGVDARVVTRVIAQRGVVTRQSEERTRHVYAIRNNDADERTIVIEHPMRAGWTIDASIKPVETAIDVYRIAVPAPARQTVTLTVDEKRPLEARYEISMEDDSQWSLLLRDSAGNRTVLDALQPIAEKKAALAAIRGNITGRDAQMKQIAADQQRIRENLKSLQDTSEQRALAKRFAAQLTEQEDRLEALRSEINGLVETHRQAKAELQQLLDRLALDLRIEGQAGA
jgi:hypothetical protein